jgi:hypothetical protein
MAEWFKALVLKTRDRKVRGFESYSLRHLLTRNRRFGQVIYLDIHDPARKRPEIKAKPHRRDDRAAEGARLLSE